MHCQILKQTGSTNFPQPLHRFAMWRTFSGLAGLATAWATCDSGTCARSLLQTQMRSDDVAKDAKDSKAGPPRHELFNLQVPLITDYVVPDIPDPNKAESHKTDHQKCNSNTPDGRLFFCGESYRHIRYFKFESLTFSDGIPVFNDNTWSLWKETLSIWRPWRASLCFPNWKQPFEVLPNGNHFYAMYSNSDRWRSWLNVTIAKPMTPEAEIVDVQLGSHERINTLLPRYGSYTGLMLKQVTSEVF